jgi:mannose/fructose/N-acetylgalactosamine-specific phosphotransferase system component IID
VGDSRSSTPSLIVLLIVILSDERSEESKDLRLFFNAMKVVTMTITGNEVAVDNQMRRAEKLNQSPVNGLYGCNRME